MGRWMSGGHPFSADRNGMKRVEYMTLYLRDLENQDIGLEKGLEALVNSLRDFFPDEEALYQAVIKNEAYKDTPREEVFKYLK